MNYLLDSNILLYAKMDSMPEHKVVSKWLEETVLDQNNTISICETTLLSFLRIATNEKVFQPVLPTGEAEKFINSLLNCANVNLIHTSADHFLEVIKLMDKLSLQGNLVMDIHLAVLALTTGATLATRDKDFIQIPYLKIFNPLSVKS
jgi:toxin-antitoxin system PIN domain toxin